MAGVAHEMNTPVGSIRSSADTGSRALAIIRGAFQDEAAKGLQQTPAADRAVRAGGRGRQPGKSLRPHQRTVDSMRKFVRLDEGKYKRVAVTDGLE